MTAPLPPRAPGLPFFGNARPFFRDPLGFLLETQRRHGDVVRVSLGPMKTTLLAHPDLVEQVLVTDNKRFQKDAFVDNLRPVLGDGLLTSEGDFWRRQRRLAQPAFHRERIAGYGAIMIEYASALARTYRDGQIRAIHKDMMRLTLEIVAKTLFGADVGDSAEVVGEALEVILHTFSDPIALFLPAVRNLPTPGQKRFHAAIARLDAVLYRFIEARRKGPERPEAESSDLLSMLLRAQDEDGSRMSDKQLRDEVMTLFLAGHETTALALSWTWHLLSQHPSVDRQLGDELRDVLGDRDPTPADLPRLPYTSAVVQESMRLYPPAWSLGREAREDIELGGFLVPKGAQVWMCPWSIQRDPRFYPEPNTFEPERWRRDSIKSLHKYAYFPFGGGPRLCIGQAFAQMEAILLLATLARAFRIEVQPDPVVTPVPSVTLRPKHGMRGRIVRR